VVALPQLPVGPGTPYITPAVLRSAPTGIDWTTIPSRNADQRSQQAEQANICLRATGMIEGATNQVLRATLDEEFFSGPDYRVTISPQNCVARVTVSRWPILQVVSCQVASTSVFPRTWTTIAANQLDIEKPPIGLFGAAQAADVPDGGQAILIAPGVITWLNGRNGYRIQLQYVSGWPHTSLTAPANDGATTVSVDDCTGWAPSIYDPEDSTQGAVGIFYDGLYQEVAMCTASSVTAGPGTLNLATPLTFQHSAGVLFTTLPRSVMNATIDMASSIALERGATATTVQSVSGGAGTAGGGPLGVKELRELAKAAVSGYARVI
jgi:hypothetical protein